VAESLLEQILSTFASLSPLHVNPMLKVERQQP
jgi:hypothetical protein